VNRIAGQAVFAGQRPNAPAFQPAEAALRRSPECAIRTEPKVQDLAGAQAIFCRVRDTEPVSREVRDPALVETKPDAALPGVRDRRGARNPRAIPTNDVWSSEDGVNWKQVTASAPWKPRLWFSAVVYRDHLWVLGGWSETGNLSDVWYTKDGRNWTELKSDVIWTKRHEHSAFVFQDKIWVAGGAAEPSSTLDSQVWSLEIPPNWF
jgi:hypothetical protein